MMYRCVLIGVLVVGACGDDDDTPPVDAAAPPDQAIAQPDAAVFDAGPNITGGEFSSPSDFPRVGCVAGSFSLFDPVGVWGTDVHTDYGGGYTEDYGGAFRVSQGGLESYQALISGGAAAATLTEDDLFVRRVSTDALGRVEVRAIDACTVNADGSLIGSEVYCSEANLQFGAPVCLLSTFRAVRVHRIAGESVGQGLSLLGEFEGTAVNPWPAEFSVNVRVKDHIAYVARFNDGIRIVDVSDPANMKDVGRYFRTRGFNDVKVFDGPGGTTYMAATRECRGIDVVDVSDPANPTKVANFPANAGCIHTLFVEEQGGQTRAYFTNQDGGLSVWDLTDPTTPVELGTYRHPSVDVIGGFVHDLSVANGIAYLNYWNLGLVVVDASDAANITLLGQFDDYERRSSHSNWVTTVNGCKIAVDGDEDYGAHLRVIGVDPACPATFMQQLGELSLRPEVSIHNIMAFGNIAYVAYYQDGVRLFDLTDPTQPVQLAYFNTWNESQGQGGFFEGAVGIDVDLAEQKIYVADLVRGLIVLHID